MPSSTSSSDFDTLVRDLPAARLGLAGIIALLICAAGVLVWENHWRNFGAEPEYFINSDSLWAIQRRRIDNGEGNKTVAVGSSRILFDLQLGPWEQVSGERPIQLALEGTTPLGIMEDLADDPDFTGTLLVGVSPGLFFSGFEYRKSAFDMYHEESPSNWTGQQLGMLIEPHFSFLHPDFALFTVLERLQHDQWLPERDAVVKYRDVRKLSNMAHDRNAQMWHKVEDDPEYSQLAKTIWAQRHVPISERSEEELQQQLDSRDMQIERAVAAVNKLHAKGVPVVFIRLPSQGYYAELREPQYNPRAENWDVLIEKTGALGLHWQDHEEMQGYTLPEWSHMSAADATEFTPKLYRLVERELARRENQQKN